MSRAPRVVVLDHKDSFVFILAEQFKKLGAEVAIYRSDELDVAGFERLLATSRPELVVLSPGPGRPEDGGVTVPWLGTRPRVFTLGVCLGHQAMALAAGARIDRAPVPVHGRASRVALGDDPLFEGLPRTMSVARYHSLVATDLPPALRSIATLADGGPELCMALRHAELPQLGFQFHPESVLTTIGPTLIERVLREAIAHAATVCGQEPTR